MPKWTRGKKSYYILWTVFSSIFSYVCACSFSLSSLSYSHHQHASLHPQHACFYFNAADSDKLTVTVSNTNTHVLIKTFNVVWNFTFFLYCADVWVLTTNWIFESPLTCTTPLSNTRHTAVGWNSLIYLC